MGSEAVTLCLRKSGLRKQQLGLFGTENHLPSHRKGLLDLKQNMQTKKHT